MRVSPPARPTRPPAAALPPEPRVRRVRRVLAMLTVAQLLTAPLSARFHEPQEPLDLLAGLRHVMESSALATPVVSAKSRDAGRSADAREPTRRGSGLPLSSSRGDARADDQRSRSSIVAPGADGAPLRLDRASESWRPGPADDLIDLGLPGRRADATDTSRPGIAVPVVERLAPERADLVVSALRPDRRARAAEQASDRAGPRRARSPLAPAKLVPDAALGQPALPLSNQALDGSGHMEVHWSALDGVSTFVGGSQAEEAAHSTAFGRDIGAEAGVQITDSEARAYRIMVARTFKNDLDAPIQAPRLRLEVNVRF